MASGIFMGREGIARASLQAVDIAAQALEFPEQRRADDLGDRLVQLFRRVAGHLDRSVPVLFQPLDPAVDLRGDLRDNVGAHLLPPPLFQTVGLVWPRKRADIRQRTRRAPDPADPAEEKGTALLHFPAPGTEKGLATGSKAEVYYRGRDIRRRMDTEGGTT